jgi:hypothetical protein
MAECARCKVYTELFDNGVPICPNCSVAQDGARKRPPSVSQIRMILKNELAQAMERSLQASDAFLKITTEVPSGLPHPDGIQRIHNASRDLSKAREDMAVAHRRLNDYLTRGIVPEDLRQID